LLQAADMYHVQTDAISDASRCGTRTIGSIVSSRTGSAVDGLPHESRRERFGLPGLWMSRRLIESSRVCPCGQPPGGGFGTNGPFGLWRGGAVI